MLVSTVDTCAVRFFGGKMKDKTNRAPLVEHDKETPWGVVLLFTLIALIVVLLGVDQLFNH